MILVFRVHPSISNTRPQAAKIKTCFSICLPIFRVTSREGITRPRPQVHFPVNTQNHMGVFLGDQHDCAFFFFPCREGQGRRETVSSPQGLLKCLLPCLFILESLFLSQFRPFLFASEIQKHTLAAKRRPGVLVCHGTGLGQSEPGSRFHHMPPISSQGPPVRPCPGASRPLSARSPQPRPPSRAASLQADPASRSTSHPQPWASR